MSDNRHRVVDLDIDVSPNTKAQLYLKKDKLIEKKIHLKKIIVVIIPLFFDIFYQFLCP